MTRELAAIAAALAVVVTCTSCQKAKSVIAVNDCGRGVQADASDEPSSLDPQWTPLAAGSTKDIRQIIDQATEVFIRVRASSTAQPITFRLPVDASSEADVLVKLRGDRCPDA